MTTQTSQQLLDEASAIRAAWIARADIKGMNITEALAAWHSAPEREECVRLTDKAFAVARAAHKSSPTPTPKP